MTSKLATSTSIWPNLALLVHSRMKTWYSYLVFNLHCCQLSWTTSSNVVMVTKKWNRYVCHSGLPCGPPSPAHHRPIQPTTSSLLSYGTTVLSGTCLLFRNNPLFALNKVQQSRAVASQIWRWTRCPYSFHKMLLSRGKSMHRTMLLSLLATHRLEGKVVYTFLWLCCWWLLQTKLFIQPI